MIVVAVTGCCNGQQKWTEQPRYQEVNPHGSVIMPCVIMNKKGECRWEKDGNPVGMYPTKYEFAGSIEKGDCSLKILDANLEYDDGVWQCQVTPSSFQSKDSLISEGAELVVREAPNSVMIQRVGDATKEIIAAAGEDLELECIATGANPPAILSWYANGQAIASGHVQENKRQGDNERIWTSFSRLTLPVSKEDNGAEVKCVVTHPALDEPIFAEKPLTIHYPPTVRIETSPMDNLEDEKDSVTLRCIVDSNPRAAILWRKEGLNGDFSPEQEIVFSPVTRHTAGLYSCTAENQLGMSKADYVKVDVKFSPRILSVGPTKVVTAQLYNKTVLTCEAEGNPPPQYTWLQMKPTQEVQVRAHTQEFVIENVTYDDQGEFACIATNIINGEERKVQSEPVKVEVTGAPQVLRSKAQKFKMVPIGDDAILEVEFCANPMSNQSWHLDNGSGNKVILASGTGHGRFIAETVKNHPNLPDCYISTLKINGAHPTDSHNYELRLSNQHGVDTHTIQLAVKEHVGQEFLIAVVIGCVISGLVLILVTIYMVKAGKCCCCSKSSSHGSKKDCKPNDLESDKTDLESTHSSNMSGHIHHNSLSEKQVIPPDALYSCSNEKIMKNSNAGYISYEAVFNDSKESLRPDLVSSNLNRTNSSSGDLNVNRISYNDLCFPKTSNYGSMKKKSRHQQYIVQQLRNQKQIQQAAGATNSVGHPVQQQQQSGATSVGHPVQSAYPQHHFEPPLHYQPPPPRRHIYVHEPCN